MCESCIHIDVCKYIEEYKEQLSLVDTSKLTTNDIVIFARCKRFKDVGRGIYIVEPTVLYGNYTGEY